MAFISVNKKKILGENLFGERSFIYNECHYSHFCHYCPDCLYCHYCHYYC